jgi:hypothetical protein
MCGRCVGLGVMLMVDIQGDHLSVGGEMGGGNLMGGRFALVIGGTLPRMLFCVRWDCVCLVNFYACLVVGFGASMMGGALVILVSAGIILLLSFIPCLA